MNSLHGMRFSRLKSYLFYYYIIPLKKGIKLFLIVKNLTKKGATQNAAPCTLPEFQEIISLPSKSNALAILLRFHFRIYQNPSYE